jgi:endo-1,4-beta-xylanase
MHSALRAGIFVLWLTLVCLGSGGSSSEESLRDAAQGSGMLVGAAARPAQLAEVAYAATFAREFNMLEPEDAMKWEALRPDPKSFNFSQADQLVDFALRHNMRVRGHALVWHHQIPRWLTEGQFTPDQLARLLETHIKTVVGHYRGKVFAWDVVNEAFDEPGRGQLRDTIWYDRPGIGLSGKGTAYLERCFRWAHEADPAALLFYNEGDDAEILGPKSDAIYAMVRDFRKRDVPIHGVGLQMHSSNLHPDFSSISANIGPFTALGVQVHITEMDVSLPVDAKGNATSDDLQQQAIIYRQIAEASLSHRGSTAIQTWGFTDNYSWIGSHSRKTRGAALLFLRSQLSSEARLQRAAGSAR